MWIAYAFGSALFAGLTSILAKRSRSPAHHCGAGDGLGGGIRHRQTGHVEKHPQARAGLPGPVRHRHRRILVTIVFSYVVFHETLTRKALIGLLLIVGGTLLMLV